MCGIAGLLNFDVRPSESELRHVAQSMSSALRHRGPDDEGIWADSDAGIALAHRRLSIVDLSPAGHQPMVSSDGRYVVTYNGEFYNYQGLRSELEGRGVRFRGHSDTEIALEAFSAYGIAETIKRLIGMFSLTVWDRRDRTLVLVRDRLGIKPLYWGKFGGLFLFGSELKALRACPGWTPKVNNAAIASYLRHNYVPAPHTIYEGVHKLEPGSILTLPWNGEPRIERFWDARTVALTGLASPIEASDEELIEQLETLLKDAVKRRMVADVPVGAFLSGGVDSSTVVALMRAANAGKVKTYTIGFDIAGFDEAPHAKAVANHLQTEHTELTATAQDALDVIPRLPDLYDEPFADSSQIPTYLVSALTRKHVTVALSGDGGDELFAGYNRYRFANRTWGAMSRLPHGVRKGISAALTGLSPAQWSRVLAAIPARYRPPQLGDKLHKFASVLTLDSADDVYRQLISHWQPLEAIPNVVEPKGLLWDPTVADQIPGLTDRMQFLDLVTYLPDDILTKVDRASMAVGLEARVPLLDHRVVEFAWRLPQSMKIRNGTGRWLLRQVLYRHVPQQLIERPKMGFGIPLDHWLRGPLREWAESLLAEQRLGETGLLNVRHIRERWAEHLSGHRNWQHHLWSVLMFEAWRDRWSTKAAA